jgi:hypothetical protein
MPRPTSDQIDDQLNKAHEVIDDPDNRGFWGQSYEEGVVNALRWVTGEYSDAPMDND